MQITPIEAAKELLANDNIMIISHMSPDGDTLGSSFGLYNALTSLNKHVKVRCSDKVPAKFAYLQEGYVDNDFSEDYVVCVDVAATQLFGDKLSSYIEKVDLCIDHHPSNDFYAKKTCLNAKAGATCELVFEIIELLGAKVTSQIADCLYTGITTDTGCFKYSNTTAQTHIVTAELIKFGADYAEINRFLFDTKSKSRIEIEQHVLNTMEFFYNDRVALIAISQKTIERTHADESELDGVSALPRTIEGVQIGITIREKTNGAYKLSLRTTSEVDASEICQIFGGGGHKRAAGCLIEADFESTKKMIVEAVGKFLL